MLYGIIFFLHILGATIWTGGHIVLATTVLPRALKQCNADILIDFEQGYEKIGMPALFIQIITGLWLSHNIIPNWHDWLDFRNPIVHVLMLKLSLLFLTLCFAIHAQLRVIPRLSVKTLPIMAWHIIPVTIFSILFVFAGVSFRTGWFYS